MISAAFYIIFYKFNHVWPQLVAGGPRATVENRCVRECMSAPYKCHVTCLSVPATTSLGSRSAYFRYRTRTGQSENVHLCFPWESLSSTDAAPSHGFVLPKHYSGAFQIGLFAHRAVNETVSTKTVQYRCYRHQCEKCIQKLHIFFVRQVLFSIELIYIIYCLILFESDVCDFFFVVNTFYFLR